MSIRIGKELSQVLEGKNYFVEEKAVSIQESSTYMKTGVSYLPIYNEEKAILIVDDNQPTLDLLDLLLTDAGYKVKQANNKAEAIAELKSEKFFAMLTDLSLPQTTGWVLAQEARQYQPEIKVVLMTGYSNMVNHPSNGLVDKVLAKPLCCDELLQLIECFSV